MSQVNLGQRLVRTLAGNGSKAANDYVGGRKGRAQQLNSPWDLALDSRVSGGHPSRLQLTCAGLHLPQMQGSCMQRHAGNTMLEALTLW